MRNLAEICIALITCCRVNEFLAQKAAFAFLICYRFINPRRPETQLWLRVSTLEEHGSLEPCDSTRQRSTAHAASRLNEESGAPSEHSFRTEGENILNLMKTQLNEKGEE